MKLLLLLASLLFSTPFEADAEQSSFLSPNDVGLVPKLGVTESDWKEIQQLISKHKEHYVFRIEKSPIGFIGAWLASLPRSTNPTGGPVYFFEKQNGAWAELSEMSVWGDHK
ncbi:MAG: hypothetical protein K9L79_15225 [Methylobacter tundripaludum]|nr:hypothetical protein [Methylobacter tundripaludum]